MPKVFARSVSTLLLFAFTAIVGNAVAAQTQRGETATLTGAWALNTDLSDDAAKVMEKVMGGDHGGSGGGHTPPAGVGGGHGPGMHSAGGSRGGMSPEQVRAMRARMSDVLDAPAKLTMVEGDGSVTLTDNTGRSRRLIVNGKREKRPMDNRMVDVRTKWDDGRLVSETWLDDGMKLTETYALAPSRRQLIVSLKVEGSHLPRAMNFRRVYDPDTLR
jgi:hypothetical protein